MDEREYESYLNNIEDRLKEIESDTFGRDLLLTQDLGECPDGEV